MAEGLADKMIRVDMTTQTATVEPFPAKWRLLGGRALSARILLEECDPELRAARPGQRARDGARRAGWHLGADLRPHLDRRARAR